MSSYHHVWPDLEFGWKVVVGSIVAFLGAAMGSVGGVGGGAIFVPMLVLIIGFDPKSSAAVSKCMIMGTAGSTVYYNLRRRHPTLNLPLIDYDLALLFQPMLMVGISVGVAFNIVFADWMITVLLIILFIVNSTRSFIKGTETWRKETLAKQEATNQQESDDKQVGQCMVFLKNSSHCSVQSSVQLSVTEVTERFEESKLGETENEAMLLLNKNDSGGGSVSVHIGPDASPHEITILNNIKWKQLSLLVFVWVAFFAVQIMKTAVVTCSTDYWILNSLQVIIGSSVAVYQAVCLYKGTAAITSCGRQITHWTVSQILVYFFGGILAGTIGGLLGIGGGTILTPLFLELGVPPQVASATSAISMLFSSSMSVVQYFILKRFPIPYSAYLCSVAAVAALTGQHVVSKIIAMIGRTSIIIFILAFTIFVSALCLGGVGITRMIHELRNHEYMGFESMCH
uniref:Sulfite exporter TauE/SafE family protein n=1 Tax=Opuntia streptacantha TaxID=393608 RepID=A0A7C9EJ21_OPUST